MEINRSNYEVWFTDLMDGNLNPQQEEILRQFLIENPDLREEIIDISPARIIPSKVAFNNKEQLKKSPADITRSQFEYLCVAYLENDLSPEQKAELSEIINLDKKKAVDFEIFRKIRLSPVANGYPDKKKLLRRTVTQNVISLSVIGLSVAAAVTLFITIYLSVPFNTFSPDNITYRENKPDTSHENSSTQVLTENIISDQREQTKHQQIESKPAETIKDGLNEFTSVQNEDILLDSTKESNYTRETPVNKIAIHSPVMVNEAISPNKLIAINSALNIPVEAEERSDIARFISKTFREKIMKEDSPSDSPLKGYEIAEAGITGINKLLGWDMALNKKSDENGELRSVYFSSKILKFNTPVKMSEPEP